MPKEKIIIKDEGIEEVQETSWEEEFELPPEKVWDGEEIKKYLNRRAKLLRRTPSKTEIDKDKEGPRMKKVKKVFGTYEHAILASGLQLPPPYWTEYSNEELLEFAREWGEKHPKVKMTNFILDEHPNLPRAELVRQRFGGLPEYCKLAGIPCGDGSTPWRSSQIGGIPRPVNAMVNEMFHQGR